MNKSCIFFIKIICLNVIISYLLVSASEKKNTTIRFPTCNNKKNFNDNLINFV